MKQPNWCHLREKLIQGESLEMPVKAVFKATETSFVADDSDSNAEHDTVKSRERSEHPQMDSHFFSVVFHPAKETRLWRSKRRQLSSKWITASHFFCSGAGAASPVRARSRR